MNRNLLFPLTLIALVLSGCASVNLPPPKPEAINFDQIQKDPSADIKQSLKVDISGSGIKNTKKFVIGAFQVRFRESLSGRLKLNDRNCNGEAVDVYSLSDNNSGLFQKVTQDLYKQFVSDLKQRGYQIVDFSEMKKQPEFQTDLKGEVDSGKMVELTASEISNPYMEDAVLGQIPVGDIFGKQTKAHYSIYSPGEVPNFDYSTRTLGMTTYLDDNYDKIVLEKNVPPHHVEAAARVGAGVIAVGFEVELMKYNYDACTIQTMATITHAPMVRTRLTSFKALPVGAKGSTSLFGSYSINNGLVITPKSRGGTKGSGFIRSMMAGKEFGTRWVEVDDGSVTINADNTEAVPVAAKFPAAFKQSTGAHLQMIMHVLDHQAEYN